MTKETKVWLLQVWMKYEEIPETIGIFSSEKKVKSAKRKFLKRKMKSGLEKRDFTFQKSEYVLDEIVY